MARRAPAFQFYVDDFIGGTHYMGASSVGVYVRLLCFQFASGLLPSCHKKLARIAGVSDNEFESCWEELSSKFASDGNGKIFNERLKAIVEEQVARSEARSSAGKLGGKHKTKRKQNVNKHVNKNEAKGEGVGEGVGEGSGDGLGAGTGATPIGVCRTGSELDEVDGKSLSKAEMPEAIEAVFDHYRKYHPRSKPGDAERKRLRERFRDGYSINDLRHAIDGCHVTPHNCGENESGAIYQALELILRDSSQVARFIENFTHPPQRKQADPRGSMALLEQRRRDRASQSTAE